MRTDALLAILIGSPRPEAAVSALYNAYNEDLTLMEELKDVFNKTFVYSPIGTTNGRHRALGGERRGHRARQGARPAAGLGHGSSCGRQPARSFEIDNGPHSMTRAQLRWRLMRAAKGNNDVKRAEAIHILKFINEKGVLMALRNEPGPVGEMARQAFFEVINPKATAESVPESAEGPAAEAGGRRLASAARTSSRTERTAMISGVWRGLAVLGRLRPIRARQGARSGEGGRRERDAAAGDRRWRRRARRPGRSCASTPSTTTATA